MFRILWWLFVWLGRPFGGIRPRRITNWLAVKAYGNVTPTSSDYRWYRDQFGIEFLLHPHFFMDSQIIAFGAFDVDINKYIERHIRPGMICLDVGANVGIMSVHLAKKVVPSGLVHCFEPVPHLFSRLQLHVERNKVQTVVRLHPLALSDKEGASSMVIADESFSNQGMGTIVEHRHSDLVKKLTIQTTTLDAFAEKEGLNRLDFVKVDIQGAELLFLQGGRNTLMKLKPDLLIEIGPDELASCGTTSKELLRQIESLGYESFELNSSGQIAAKRESSNTSPDYWSAGLLCRMKKN